MPTLDNLIKLKQKSKKIKAPTDDFAPETKEKVPAKPQKKEKTKIEPLKLNSKEIIESRILKEENKKKNYEKSTQVPNQ